VFPVLSLKVLGFAAHGGDRATMRKHGLAFAAESSFRSGCSLPCSLRCARPGTARLGLPAAVAGGRRRSALLFFVLALNLSGLFEIRLLLPSSLAGWNAKNPYVNDALSGVLAAVIASPCSAPFMGAALGYALTSSIASTWIVFTTLGVGMALPYLALAYFPAWRSKLPKPGAWMRHLRQLLAFPLYATVIWLAWVLGAQLDNDAVARLAQAADGRWRSGPGRRCAPAARAWGASAITKPCGRIDRRLAGGRRCCKPGREASGRRVGRGRTTPQRVARLVAANQPVFVDFTAAWCVTCQVNKRRSCSNVRRAFAQGNVAGARRLDAPRWWLAPRLPRWDATACRFTSCTGRIRRRCCCRSS
jgi:thiol:disulfide interchange protein DsbD